MHCAVRINPARLGPSDQNPQDTLHFPLYFNLVFGPQDCRVYPDRTVHWHFKLYAGVASRSDARPASHSKERRQAMKATTKNKARAILHIDMDTFFCSVERLFDASLEGKPVIVGGDPSQRGVVAACSYEAREYGVHSAMPLAKAGKLCPHAVYLPGNFKAYIHYSGLVRDILDEYTPLIEHAGIDEAYLDLSGCRLAFGDPGDVTREIRKRIADELGLPASGGLSAAKVVSKVASAAAKPNGFLEIKPGEELSFLSPLPVEKLPGVGPVCRASLHDLCLLYTSPSPR